MFRLSVLVVHFSLRILGPGIGMRDTRDSNSDKDGDHDCGDLCAGIVLVICKSENAIYCGNKGIESFKHCMKKL